jgi:hypothetical protein
MRRMIHGLPMLAESVGGLRVHPVGLRSAASTLGRAIFSLRDGRVKKSGDGWKQESRAPHPEQHRSAPRERHQQRRLAQSTLIARTAARQRNRRLGRPCRSQKRRRRSDAALARPTPRCRRRAAADHPPSARAAASTPRPSRIPPRRRASGRRTCKLNATRRTVNAAAFGVGRVDRCGR